MSDDDPAVYKPAPGDLDKSGKLKKTKPSKHTLKFKKMFGEIEMRTSSNDWTRNETCKDKSIKDMLVRLLWCRTSSF